MEWRAGMIRRREDWLCGELVGVLQWGFEERGGGHRVKMREDPPSGARTLIDFYLLLALSSTKRRRVYTPIKQGGGCSFRCIKRLWSFVLVAWYFLLNGLTGSAAWRLTCVVSEYFVLPRMHRPSWQHLGFLLKIQSVGKSTYITYNKIQNIIVKPLALSFR